MIRCRNSFGTVIVTAAPLRHLRSEGTDDRLFRRYRIGDHDAAVLRGLGGTACMALDFRRIPGFEQRMVFCVWHRWHHDNYTRCVDSAFRPDVSVSPT